MDAGRYLKIFKIHKSERLVAVGALVLIGLLNALLIVKYYDVFTPLNKNYFDLFVYGFKLSGFDPLTYSILSDWGQQYNVYRHPLLAYMMYPFYLLNQGLIYITGINCAIFIVAIFQTLLGMYSALMLYRIIHKIIGLGRGASTVITGMFYGFAYVMLSVMAPDHFGPSMMLLLTTLYISGMLMKKGQQMNIWQTVLLFVFTAGVSLNNGIKTYLSALFVNGKKLFRPKYMLLAVILPSALIWQSARWTYDYYLSDDYHERVKKRQVRAEKEKAERDSLELLAKTDTEVANRLAREDSIAKIKQSKKRVTQGEPIAKGEFSQWTDITTPRTESIVENLMGEGIQLHEDHLLEDQLISRPVIVSYNNWWQYAVEGVLSILFLAGIWFGRKKRFMWLVMSYFCFDMLIHIVLGFGINEVYIMSAHYLFVIPIVAAYLFKALQQQKVAYGILISLTSCLALYLWVSNGMLLIEKLFS